MTENLAGRGEGLAGLVAERIKECRETAQRWRTESRIVRINRAIGKDYANQLDALASLLGTALEAAAPASTARERELLQAVLNCETHHDERGHAYLKVPARSLNDLAAVIAAALATPSPQAPAEQCNAFSPTSAREQSSATASAIPSVGDEYNLRVYKVEGHWYVDIDTEKPHSGLASGATPELAMDSAKEMLTHMRECEVKDGRRTCE